MIQTLAGRAFITATIVVGAWLLPGPVAHAQRLVSIEGAEVNMRSGPGTGHEVLWVLNKGYPLKVLRRQGRWLEVQDFENDKGWVARALTGRTPHHVVKSRIVNIRKGPGTGHPIIGQAEYGEVLRTRSKRRDWVQVERAEGQPGWVAKRLLWGW